MSIADKVLQLKQDFDEVYEAGEQVCWDMLTDYGNRDGYAYGFYGWRLVDSNGKVLFKPQYDIKPTVANSMFEQTKGAIDLHDAFTNAGKELDFSKCTAMNRVFFRSEVAKLGIIDCTSTSSLTSTFYQCSNLIEIIGIVFSKDKNYTFAATFSGCNSLTNMTAKGSLASSGLDLSACPLTRVSKLSFLNILEPTTTTKTITFGAGETLTNEDVSIGTQKGWSVVV